MNIKTQKVKGLKLLFMILAAMSCSLNQQDNTANKPSILFISIDDLKN